MKIFFITIKHMKNKYTVISKKLKAIKLKIKTYPRLLLDSGNIPKELPELLDCTAILMC